MKNMLYSHKNEVAEYLRFDKSDEYIKSFSDGAIDVLNAIKNSQTFRLPHIDSLPVFKDYSLFYEFMKMPYKNILIEIPTDDGWLVYTVHDFMEDNSVIFCFVLIKKNNEWRVVTDLTIEMDETGYEVKTELETFDDDVKRRFAWTVFEFMIAVNTPNIRQVEIKPPKLINAKRKAKGKPVLEGYKYLDLMPKEVMNCDSTGIGSAKRMH